MLEIDDQLQTMSIEEQQMRVEPIERLKEVPLDSIRLNRTTRIGTLASPTVHLVIIAFLKENQDVFTWNHEDMSRIDPSVMVHRLNVSPSFPPVQQKKQVFAQERDQATAEEVGKLQEAGFIREVYYLDWLANMVMVKKANGKWRMCVDFMDLNKACPKDSYHLPRVYNSAPATELHGRLFRV